MRTKQLGTNLLTVAVVVLVLCLVIYPEPAFQAAESGLKIFWNIVFPSLLPFFVLSEIMLGLGVVHFIGVLFEPLMRPLFSVPGEGAFALSMGLAAGYPMDAVITGKFRRQGMCTRVEGERLLAFTNTADPLFMFGAVAVGMFGIPTLGATLALAHYLSAFSVGLLFKLWGRGQRDVNGTTVPRPGPTGGNILVRALSAMARAREEDGRSFGQLMGDAVNDSVKTLLMIGGFIMVFSVLVRILQVTGAEPIVTAPLGVVFRVLHLDANLLQAALQGLFEIDLGTVAASKAAAPFLEKVVMASAVIAWSGFSVHGQVASVISGTDISMKPYFLARFLHAVLAGVYTLFLMGPAAPAVAAVFHLVPAASVTPAATGLLPFWEHLQLGFTRALVIPAALALGGFLAFLPRTLRVTWFRLTR